MHHKMISSRSLSWGIFSSTRASDGSECDFFSMIHMMAFFQYSELLWIACAPVSCTFKPIPERSISFTSLQTAGVCTLLLPPELSQLFTPSSIKVLKQSSASAIAGLCCSLLPSIAEVALLLLHALFSSKYCHSASPIPATVRRNCDLAMISVSIEQDSDLPEETDIFQNSSSVYINNRQSTARGICRCDRRTNKYRCSRIVCNCSLYQRSFSTNQPSQW